MSSTNEEIVEQVTATSTTYISASNSDLFNRVIERA